MKKYFEIAKITFKSQIAYRFDIIIGLLLSFVRIMLAFILWRVIFEGKDEIAGFSFAMMMTYYIIISFLRRLDLTDEIVWQLSSEIREGQFTKYLIRPIKPLWYFVTACLAKMAYVLGLNIAATVLYALIFSRFWVVQTDTVTVLCAILIFVLGLSFMILLNYFIAILSFKFTDVGALNMIKGNILEFLTGALIPLTLLPGWLQNGMQLFPFYYVYYYPTALLLKGPVVGISEAILLLALWNAIMYAIVSMTYQALKRKYEGVGV